MTAEQAAPTDARRGFGTFEGVFTPTVLTILGVILFLRTGWVVGNAGLLGGVAIILLAYAITGATGLSLASVATNVRIGAGGAYSVIAQSLGVEAGGSIGLPLYLSQALAVTLYVFGFREGWQFIFPGHPALVVDLTVLAVLFGIAYVSARFAFRVQYVILGLIVVALGTVVAAAATGSMQHSYELWGRFPGDAAGGGVDFWTVFAVFFPAATGIMAGANMSGELADPRRSIPVGTMAAIGVSLVVYLGVAYWLARSASTEELVTNFTVLIDHSAWPPAALAGLLGATFSSALVSIVGAPRILQALGAHQVLPGGQWVARTSRGGEPRNAMVVTGGIVLLGLLVRDLNAVAPLITMFFLITYLMINLVVYVEQRLGLVSFRPSFAVPRSVPLFGVLGCLLAMFVVNAVFGLFAVALVIAMYGYLTRRHLTAPFGDVRSGLFVAVAEWAAQRVSGLRGTQERAWKPNLLVPVEDPDELVGTYRLLEAIAGPKGSIKLMGLVTGDGQRDELASRLDQTARDLRGDGIFTTVGLVEAPDYAAGLITAMSVLQGAFFRPNMVFATMPRDRGRAAALRQVADQAPRYGLGVVVFADHPRAGLGRRRTINVWLRTADWRQARRQGQLDLAVLLAYKLLKNWNGRLRLLSVVDDEEHTEATRAQLRELMIRARLPDADVRALSGDFEEQVGRAPRADVGILGLPAELDVDRMRRLVGRSRSACLFVLGSGQESITA